MTGARRAGLVVLWLVALAALAFGVSRALVVSNDLRSFMPPAQTADQRLLLDQIGEGPAARLLLLAISAPAPDVGVALSQGLAAALRGDARFSDVLNGDTDLSALDPEWLPYRYLLSPTLDHATFDADFLRAQLEQRLQDLGSPGAELLKPLLPRDPTLETLALAQRWTPAHAPVLRDGVWFSPHDEALLLVQTRAAGFDPSAQAAAIDALRDAFAHLPDAGAARLEISGPGYFGAIVSARTRAEAEWLSLIGTLGFAALLLLAYRSAGVLALVALPIASGALAGLVATAAIFHSIHGITLAFGVTLLGVAQEYPIRVFSHRRAGASVRESLAGVWPLLRLAIVSACIAYVTFFASGVTGLQQLAAFTITGLLVAGAATRWLLPAVLPAAFRDVAQAAWLRRLQSALDALPRPRSLPWLVLAIAIVLLWLAPAPFWQNDLAALTPVPPALLQREGELRNALGAPDVRYLLVLEAGDEEQLLALSERIDPQVDKWKTQGLVDDVELPSRYLPSLATQRARQARLPERAALEAALAQAQRDLPFQADLFAPFVDDVGKARAMPLLTPQAYSTSPLGGRLQSMLTRREGRSVALATLSNVHDAAALAAKAAALGGDGARVSLLDLKGAAESLVASYRERIGQALLAALVLLTLAVAIAFRDLRRAWHVIAPMSLATLLVLAVLRAGGVSLSLFHLIALTLAAGLGLHYALFFERTTGDAAEDRRTLHATLVCVLSAVLVFGLLAASTLPVLRAIGLTVALGVAFHFCLSTQMARPRHKIYNVD
jgi:predicted exporter